MNTVDLQRTGRKRAACAAVAAFAMLGTYQASAEVANPTLVPAESAYIISVPDASAFWKAWEANGLYDAYKNIMSMPEVESKIANFRKELAIVESSLGFKLDGETLSQIFSGADVFMAPAEGGGESTAVGVFKVADQAKLNKLLDLAEKAAAQAATGDAASTETETSDAATSAIVETEHAGVKIKVFQAGDDGSKFIYANADNYFLIGSTEEGIKNTIDRVKTTTGTATAGTVAQSEDFKKINAALAAEKGEIYFYGNQDLAMNMQATGDVPASWSNSLKGLMDDLAPLTYYGASVKIAPKELSSYSYGLLKEGSTDSLMMKNPGDKPLNVATYIPETTILTGATSLFDAKAFYDVISGVAEGAGANIDDKLEGAEAGLGFSVKNDLVPAIGNEVAFALNDVALQGLLPNVDATIMWGVKDKAKMQKVVDGIERLSENMMAAKAGDSSTSAPQFTSEEVAGQTVKSMAIPGLGGLAPTFSLTDEFLLIGSTKASVTNALEAHSGGKNLATSEVLTGLGHGISANANVLQYANLSRIWEVAQQVTGAFPAAASAGKYIDAVSVIDKAASVSRVENGAAVGRGVLTLK